jgi:GH43 family beta-xylosidase
MNKSSIKKIAIKKFAVFFALVPVLILQGCREPGIEDETGPVYLAETKHEAFNTHFYNPVNSDAADPWVIRQGNMYYYCGGSINIIASPTLSGILARKLSTNANTRKDVFNETAEGLKEIWAPELHCYKNSWYIFFTARPSNDDNDDNPLRRMYVLSNSNANPMSGVWTYRGKLDLPDNKWAIDGTFFEDNGKAYHVWSGWNGDTHDSNWTQNLYITELDAEEPWKVKSGSPRVKISGPEHDWEKKYNYQNEGPAIVKSPGGKVFCIYSASYSGSNDYCLGVLEMTGNDPMTASNWEKYPEPLLSSDPKGDVYGPGHCSITASPDGNEYWLVYHAAKAKDSGWDRNARAQRLYWGPNGRPTLAATRADPLSLKQPLPSGEQTDRVLIRAQNMTFRNGTLTANFNAATPGPYAVYVRHTNFSEGSKPIPLRVNGNQSLTVTAHRSGSPESGTFSMAAVIANLNTGMNTLSFSVNQIEPRIDLIILEKL